MTGFSFTIYDSAEHEINAQVVARKPQLLGKEGLADEDGKRCLLTGVSKLSNGIEIKADPNAELKMFRCSESALCNV